MSTCSLCSIAIAYEPSSPRTFNIPKQKQWALDLMNVDETNTPATPEQINAHNVTVKQHQQEIELFEKRANQAFKLGILAQKRLQARNFKNKTRALGTLLEALKILWY